VRPVRPVVRPSALPLLLLVLLSGCASGGGGRGDAAGVAPLLSVERFLQAANGRDLDTMARIFGNYDGPIGDTGSTFGCAFKRMGSWIGLSSRCVSRVDVELRMDAIATILRHDDFRVTTEQTVPGRVNPTSRVGVTLVRGSTTIPDIPFVVVRSRSGRWLVEQIDLERITRQE
jgi:hypothetical protein